MAAFAAPLLIQSVGALMAITVWIAVAGAEESAEPVPSRLVLSNVAWVQAATKVCKEADPAFSGHLIAAYEAWLQQSPRLKILIAWLEAAPKSAAQADAQKDYARFYAAAFRIFDDKRRTDPEDLANQCDTTTKELAEGVYDLSPTAP